MSTFMDDLKKANPALHAAYVITGNQSGVMLRNMIKALKLHSWMNTEEDKKRLAAAEFIVKEERKKKKK